jgi:hypothetical protein
MNDMYWLMSQMSNAASVLGLKASALDILPYSYGLASEDSDFESDVDFEDRDVIGGESDDGSPSHDVNSLKPWRYL